MAVATMKEKFLFDDKEGNQVSKSFIIHEFYDYLRNKEMNDEDDDTVSYTRTLYETIANELSEVLKDTTLTKESILEISNLDDELYNENKVQEEVNNDIFHMLFNGKNSKKIKDIEFTEDSIYFFGELYEYTFKNGKKIAYVTHSEEGGALFIYLLKEYFNLN